MHGHKTEVKKDKSSSIMSSQKLALGHTKLDPFPTWAQHGETYQAWTHPIHCCAICNHTCSCKPLFSSLLRLLGSCWIHPVVGNAIGFFVLIGHPLGRSRSQNVAAAVENIFSLSGAIR